MGITRSEEIVITKLEEKHGNVQAVAQALGVSDSYVNRIKKSMEHPVVKIDDETVILLRPDVPRIEGLRSTVTDYLTDAMGNGKVSVREAISLLQIVLQYELNNRGLAAPRLTINDNRTQTVNTLVDSLAKLGPEALRVLMGQVQEGEVVNETHD